MFKAIIYLSIILVALFLYVRYFERKSLYYPVREYEAMPQDYNLPFREVVFDSVDGLRLSGWFIPSNNTNRASANAVTLLFCHGNGGNISHRLDKLALLHGLGVNIFIFDYRGYGKSAGTPSEEGLYRDAEAAYDYLTKEGASRKDIVAYGESLGGAVTVELATRRPVKAVILESTFTSTIDMARILYPLFPRFLVSSRFDNISKIGGIKIPKLFLHSKNDDIVPFRQAERLYDKAVPPKMFYTLAGPHNSCYIDSGDAYLDAIRHFLNTL